MIAVDEDALICDLAETYRIYDYRSMPVALIATLSAGLRDNARIKMILTDEKVSMSTFLLCSIVDQLNLLLWAQTEDASRGENRPKSILRVLFPEYKSSDIEGFDSPEDFEKERERILGGVK